MIYWILYLSIDGTFLDFPFHFALKETCVQTGESMVKQYKYEKYRCVKEIQ